MLFTHMRLCHQAGQIGIDFTTGKVMAVYKRGMAYHPYNRAVSAAQGQSKLEISTDLRFTEL